MSVASPRYMTQFDAQPGKLVDVAPGLQRVTAPNASAYTFTGTNTFLIGRDRLIIVDPGPNDEAHLSALMAAIGCRTVEAIVLTHTHRDHSELAPKLAAAVGAPLWFAGPHRLSRPLRRFEINPLHRAGDWALLPDRTLVEGERIGVDGIDLEIITTPGHCANHICIGFCGTNLMMSGDHVMGWNSTLVATPDGSMADYLGSLEKLIALPYTRYIPAHGGPIEDGPAFARALRGHREMRNGQIVEALSSGPASIRGLTKRLYGRLEPKILLAAAMTVAAHVEYLEANGRVSVRRTLFGSRVQLAS